MRRLPQFWRHVSIVLVGTVVAQGITLAALPVFSRLLTPGELGQYYVWLATATILSVAATFRLDVAIFTAKTRVEISSLMQAAISSAVLVTAILFAIWGLISLVAPGWVHQNILGYGVAAAICMAPALAVNQTSLAAYIYDARFKRQAVAKALTAGGVAVGQVAIVAVGYGVAGMIAVQVLVMIGVVVWLIYDVQKCLALDLRGYSFRRYCVTLRDNWRFPVFSMPADFINSLAARLPLFLIRARFSGGEVGQYALTMRALAGPVGLLAGSVLSVFKEDASRQYRESGECRQAYLKTLLSLVILGSVPFVIIFFASGYIFSLVFGPQWSIAGHFGEILAPMFYLKFVASPLSYTLYIAQKQFNDLVWQLVLLAMTFSTFYVSRDILTAVKVYSAGYSGLYVVYLIMSYHAAGGKFRRPVRE